MTAKRPRPRAPARKKPAKRPRRRARGGKRTWVGIAIGVGVVMLPFWLLFAWATLPGAGTGKRVVIDWPRDDDATAAGARLARAGVITSPRLFAFYLWVFASASEVEPGTHLLDDRLSARRIAQRLTRGRFRPRKKITLPEGWTHVQLARRLEDNDVCGADAFAQAVRDPGLRRELGVDGETVEGLLYPATYDFGVDTAPAEIVRMLVTTFRKRFGNLAARHPGALEALETKRGWGDHEIVTLASIIEREAVVDSEKPIIASVYLNRLDDPEHKPEKMLQADPTAAYGCVIEPERAPSCAAFKGKVTPALLRDAANRYNTYKHSGLPPGPIASPGDASIEAVLAPATTDYLYFVAAGGGKHRFSRSLADHNKAIEETR